MKEKNPLPILPLPEAFLPPSCEALLAALEDGVCVQTPDSLIVRANQAFAEMMGLKLAQIIGHTCAEVFACAKDNGELPNFCARLASTHSGQVESEEICGRQAGQRLRSRVSPVHDDAGKIIAFVMIVRDITDIVAREKELSRVEQIARFGELSAGLAHEIKNPLAGIKGAVDILLQRRNPNDPEREVLENVQHEVSRIDATVHSLLDRARPREFKFQPASLTAAVERAVRLGRHQAASAATQRGQQIKVEFINEAAPITMMIDAAQIEDAILNLISNAIEGLEAHGSVTVHLPKQPDADEVIIQVKDTGRGISEEDLQRIFSPFFTSSPNGTGLGLPAVRRIARAHGGRVEVNSTIGSGSTFTLRLPRQA